MRLGISIPNDLHRRLEPLKQYVNVSQICREAIEERIRCYEKALTSQSDEDIISAVEQTWKQELRMRAIIEVDWGMSACDDARTWVTAARLCDWDHLQHRQDIIRKQGRPRWKVQPPYLEGTRTFDDRWYELQGRILKQDEHFLSWLHERGGIDREAAEREYMSAWLAYTDSAWELFREKRIHHIEERSRHRFEADEKQHHPAVPGELFSEIDAAD